MTIIDERNAELWRRAEEMWPRAVCICGYPAWRHWPETRPDRHSRAYDDLCAGPVRAAEVAAEYERLVAAEVAKALDGSPSGETMFWLNMPKTPLKFAVQQAYSVQYGTGFQFNNATIVRSRYAPGMPDEPPLIRTWERGGFVDVPFVPGTVPLLDEVWGWEREAVRRFLAPKIVKPKSRVDLPFPVVVFGNDPLGWVPQAVEGGTWGDVAKWLNDRAVPPKSRIEVVHELPSQLVDFPSGVVLYA